MTNRAIVPLPALLAMVAALLLLSAGPALSGDFAGTLASHAHVYLGVPHTPHSHSFDPAARPGDDVVNVSPNEAGMVVLGVMTVPDTEEFASRDAAPWLHFAANNMTTPDGLTTAPPHQPPIS